MVGVAHRLIIARPRTAADSGSQITPHQQHQPTPHNTPTPHHPTSPNAPPAPHKHDPPVAEFRGGNKNTTTNDTQAAYANRRTQHSLSDRRPPTAKWSRAAADTSTVFRLPPGYRRWVMGGWIRNPPKPGPQSSLAPSTRGQLQGSGLAARGEGRGGSLGGERRALRARGSPAEPHGGCRTAPVLSFATVPCERSPPALRSRRRPRRQRSLRDRRLPTAEWSRAAADALTGPDLFGGLQSGFAVPRRSLGRLGRSLLRLSAPVGSRRASPSTSRRG